MNFSFNRLVLLLMGIAFFSAAGAGCNTTRGFGQDVEKLGDKIEKKASR